MTKLLALPTRPGLIAFRALGLLTGLAGLQTASAVIVFSL